MAVLVTGGLGAIGAFVTRKLVEMSAEPIVYTRHRDLLLVGDIAEKLTIVQGDILDPDNLVRTIKGYGVDRIIHVSAMVMESETNPPMAIRVNAEGTSNIMEAALRCQISRVVYTSAKGVYNEAKGPHAHPTYKPINEDYPADANMGFYGLTKLFGERVGFQYRQRYGIDFVALRFSSTYGPGKIMKYGASSPLTIQSRIIENAMLGKPTRHPQGAEQKDDFVYNKDVANGIVLACFAQNLTHHLFNIGSGVGSTLLDFAAATKKVFPKAEISIGPGLDFFNIGHNVYNVFDISRAGNEIGYRPQYDLETGVRDYAEMLRVLGIAPIDTSD